MENGFTSMSPQEAYPCKRSLDDRLHPRSSSPRGFAKLLHVLRSPCICLVDITALRRMTRDFSPIVSRRTKRHQQGVTRFAAVA